MINPDKFKIQIDAESVEDLGPQVSMRVNVYDPDGLLLFQHSITIRSAFYKQVQAMPDGREQIKRVARSRCRDEIMRRNQAEKQSVEFALKLQSDQPE